MVAQNLKVVPSLLIEINSPLFPASWLLADTEIKGVFTPGRYISQSFFLRRPKKKFLFFWFGSCSLCNFLQEFKNLNLKKHVCKDERKSLRWDNTKNYKNKITMDPLLVADATIIIIIIFWNLLGLDTDNFGKTWMFSKTARGAML